MLLTERALRRNYVAVPLNVWIVGFVTLLKNMASVVLVTFCPLYLVDIAGFDMASLGPLEGALESFSFFSRIFIGILSDSLHRRKPLLVAGYITSLLGRLILAFAKAAPGIITARTLERLGNGIQGTPRDALVGDFSTPQNRGACFGLRQSMTLAGSAIGALVGMWLMKATSNNYLFLFKSALIPSLLGTIMLVLLVRDSGSLKAIGRKEGNHFSFQEVAQGISSLSRKFWKVALLAFIFMLTNYGLAFFTVKACKVGLPKSDAPLIMIIQSIGTMLVAFPAGRIADRFDRRVILAIGGLIIITANLLMSLTTQQIWVFVGVALWGVQMGIIQNNLLAFVAQTTPLRIRGTAFGIVQFVSGIGTFFASSSFGILWERFSPAVGFQTHAFLGLCALISLYFLAPRPEKIKQSKVVT